MNENDYINYSYTVLKSYIYYQYRICPILMERVLLRSFPVEEPIKRPICASLKGHKWSVG